MSSGEKEVETPPSCSAVGVDSTTNLFCAIGSPTTRLSDDEIRQTINEFLTFVGKERQEVFLLPPDFTRYHSQAGKITQMICEHFHYIPTTTTSTNIQKNADTEPPLTKKLKQEQQSKQLLQQLPVSRRGPKIEIMPALGTHAPMTEHEIRTMFGEELARRQKETFLVHKWRTDVVTIGHVPATMVAEATYNQVQDKSWPAQLNQKLWDKRIIDDASTSPPCLVISIGQVVPHEVMGMANYNKNLFVGVGGMEAINLSHFIGAVHGMEKMMGRQSNPLRDILNQASKEFLESKLDLWYILTVVGPDHSPSGKLAVRGLYIGRDIECYSRACDLSLQVNFTMVDKPFQRCVVHLDKDEFHSTWLGNKAIYRTRMAMADGGKLIIVAPGVERFGEDEQVDELIRKYGYFGTKTTMEAMNDNDELKENLSAVAHLIHGSSEGRFSVMYCPGYLTQEEIEKVGFEYGDLASMGKKYDVSVLRDGWHSDEDGEFFFISNPALGLWALRSKFEEHS